MKTVSEFIKKAFRTVVLKPFDYVFFGGSGVLYLSRDEWREIIKKDVEAAGPVRSTGSYNDGYPSASVNTPVTGTDVEFFGDVTHPYYPYDPGHNERWSEPERF